jgi:hypothetical protein
LPYDLLTEQQVYGTQTIIGVTNMKVLREEYGALFSDLIEAHYLMVGV